jgi:tetratricopeptide (TPR) repeat protein
LELDDTLAEAHTSLALVLSAYDFDFEQSLKEFERAIELNPNYATAHHWYGKLLGAIGRFDEGIAELNRAQQLDPLSLVINTDLGRFTRLHAITTKRSSNCAKPSKWILGFIMRAGILA